LSSSRSLNVGGEKKFRPTIIALAKQSAFARIRVLGVVRDCEENGKAVFESILDSLKGIGVPQPTERGEATGAEMRACVELLPPGRTTGSLETLFVEAAENVDPVRCHRIMTDCLRNVRTSAGFTQARFDKIAALALLSSQRSKYYTRVGEALQSDDFRDVLNAEPMRPLFRIVERLRKLSEEAS